jgi:hypothetical protein
MDTIDKEFSNTEISVSTVSKNFLLATAKWGNFLAIVGFVFSGIYLIGGLFFFVSGANVTAFRGGDASVVGIIYIISAILMFFPSLYLFNFSGKMKTALNNVSQENFESGLENLKSCFKFMGIMMIVTLGLIILLILFAILGAAMN